MRGVRYAKNRISTSSVHLIRYQDEDMEISAALSAHFEWRQRLTEAILDGQPFSGTFDPEGCVLGKWIESGSSGETDAVILSCVDEIQPYHTTMHHNAETALLLLENGRQAEALQLYRAQIQGEAEKSLEILGHIKE